MSGAGRIILHIGRNKAGSTTIQSACLARRAALRARGVDYVLFGHMAGRVPGVPGFALAPELAAHARADPGRTVLVSNEFMFGWPDDYTQALARDLHGLDVRVLAYLRPYGAWLRSAYAEAIGNGETARDFAAYAARMSGRISAWPHLACYGACFGWERLRVRTLDAASLEGGDLLADFFAAIGAAAALDGASKVANAAEPWPALEILKRFVARESEAGWPEAIHPAAMQARAALRDWARGVAAPDASYGGAARMAALDAAYDGDIARIGAACGTALPRAPARHAARLPEPSWALLPPALRREGMAIAGRFLPAPRGGIMAFVKRAWTDRARRRNGGRA